MHDARDRNQGIWIEPSDRLYVAAYSSVASLAVQVSGYFRRADGEVIEYAVTVNPTSDRAVTAKDVFFGGGFLLSCVASLASGNANRGQCYVKAQVQRGTGTAAVKLHMVIGGYVTDEYGPSFPYGKVEGSLEGQGAVRWILGTDPGAGLTYATSVPVGARWYVRNVQATLVNGAAVANREVGVNFDDGIEPSASVLSGRTQIASVGRSYNFSGNNAHYDASVGLWTFAHLPQVLLGAGCTVAITVENIAAADVLSAIYVQVEEWIEA